MFLRDNESQSVISRYLAGVVGLSNLTPSGLEGNTELNVIITDPQDIRYLESWFDELWKLGSTDFQRLIVNQFISTAIEKSKFGPKIKEQFVYITPKEFFQPSYQNASSGLSFPKLEGIQIIRFSAA